MNHQQQSVVADLQRLLANCGAAQTCEVSVRLVGQWLSKLTAPVGPASAPVADRERLRELVDVVWNEATESTAVPDTPWADRLIDKVFPSLAASAPVAGEQFKAAFPNGVLPNEKYHELWERAGKNRNPNYTLLENLTWQVGMFGDLVAKEASAPVAGEARQLPTINVGGNERPQQWFTAKEVRQLLDAAPQASEAVRDAAPIIGHITVKGKGRSSVDLDASHADLPEGEYVIRAALSAQPGAQRTGGSDAVPNEPLRVFSAGMWTYAGTGQAFSHTELDEAAFVTYRDALPAQKEKIDG